MKHLLALILITTCAPLLAAPPVRPTTLPRTYFIGNSLTDHFLADTRKYNPNGPAIERICKLAGLPKWEYGAKNIAGSPLWWHWYHPNEGGRGKYGATEGLARFKWDQLTLQAHGSTQLHETRDKDETLSGKTGVVIKAGDPRGDVEMCANFIKKALENPENADMQVYVYSTWVQWSAALPRDAKGKKDDKPDQTTLAALDYEKLWLAKSDPPKIYTRQYFEALRDELNKLRQPGGELAALKKPVLLIPMGDVMLALDRKLKSGELADLDPATPWKDIKDAYDFYWSIHVNPIGQIVVSYVFYATLLGQDPAGLDMRSLLNEPNQTGLKLSDDQIKVFQKTAWEVVSQHPLAGVKK